MDKYVGKRLDKRYEIEEIIGMGGMAVVYKARDIIENRTVAIKILKDEFVTNDEFIRRFKNESKAIAMLSHPNIVKVYDVSFGDLVQYIVMEYISGVTLKEHIEHQGSLRWKDAVYFTIQILKALQHAHDKGIIHRDVKPQNIMVLQDGSIKVTDFGIARFSRSEQRTITDKAIGSVHYISPEQAKGEKTDEKADVYSVGVMLYEMLTGCLPFDAERAVSVAIMQLQSNPKLPTEINPSIPLGLEQITMHAMQKQTERRYQSASEMLCDLERFKKDPEATFGYSYFIDDSPTKFVNAAPVRPVAEKPAESSGTTPPVSSDNNDSQKGATIPILGGIAAALLVVLIVLGVIFVPKLLSPTAAEIECPDFSKMTKEEIEKNEDYKDLNFEFKYEMTEDSELFDKVIRQNPLAGKKIKKGATIEIFIGSKEGLILVPNVYEMSELEAKKTLENKGLICQTEYEPSDEYEKDYVIRTEPKAKEAVAKGSVVKVYISLGKEAADKEVPDVTGLDADKAIEKLEDKGFKVQKTTRSLKASDKRYYPKDLVISQSVKAYEKVKAGSTVSIEVSDGTITCNLTIPYEAPESMTEEEVKNIKLSVTIGGVTYKSKEFSSSATKDIVIEGVVLTADEVDATVQIDDKNTKTDYCYIRITPFEKTVVTVTG